MKKLILILFLSGLILLFFAIYLQPIALVVPHHNIVADIRLKMLKLIKNKRLVTKTVIILSPDHFSSDQKSIYFSDRTWDFPSGKQYFDKKVGSMITKKLKSDNNLVANDHGIFNVASDVNVVWPNAKIVPILIGQEMSFDQISDLIFNIDKSCKFDCLLIASVDFSHYLPFRLANIHDENSIRTLTNMELANPRQIEVDSPQSINTLIRFAGNNNARYFNLYNHTNSAELVGSEDAESTSHVFGWYQRKLFANPKKYDVKTFTFAKNIDQKLSLKPLGERFFYGTDIVSLNLGEGYKLPDGTLLMDNVVVAGVETPTEIKMEFLPLKCTFKICEFERGVKKWEVVIAKP
ncbi:MAG TPA: AmmeMemoRadiSam system protein B [Patescibacteria group bacterium]|nr:AmmeMemoRadiSam system protein B [Patescibacteria group bacterium]